MLAEVVGHPGPLRVLRRAVLTDRVTHAYLFVGPPNVGKTLAAVQFAKVLNCERNTLFATAEAVDCCDKCDTCRRLERGNHADFRLVRPVANLKAAAGEEPDSSEGDTLEVEGSLISREQISQLVSDASLKVVAARRRVYLIVEAHCMRQEAANNLLKTLEEPPPDTTLILTSSSTSQLLPTIISRCQVVNFYPVAQDTVEAYLTARFPAVSPEVTRTVAALSGGRLGWGCRLLEHPQALPLRERLLALCQGLRRCEQVECLRLGEEIVDTVEGWWLATATDPELAEKALKQARDRVLRTSFPEVLDLLTSWFRDLIVVSGDPAAAQIANRDHLVQLQHLAPLYPPEGCRKVCLYLQELKRQLRQNANLRLAAEALALRMLTA